MEVSKWKEENGKKTIADYVFVSFTSQHLPTHNSTQFPEDNFNQEFLKEVGMHAARRAKTSAYWVSTSCLFDLDEGDEGKTNRQKEETVFDMSDIIRRAKAIAIAVPGNLSSQFEGTSLREWGERVWTMPELLLYTGEHPVMIYERDKCLDQDWQRSLDHPDKSPSNPNHDQPRSLDHRGQSAPNPDQDQRSSLDHREQSPSDPNHQEPVDERLWSPRELQRRELWSKVWSDHQHSGQLIDHYENSLVLSRLQLVTVALNCLYKRKTTSYYDGDISYVLMGLLRHRPNIVPSDSAFQAFARLSLANDSDRLLERMICLLPKTLDDHWWSLNDFWDVMLWDIEPAVQVCGVGDDDTVIIDGARGATIHWDKFESVLTKGHDSSIRKLVRSILSSLPGLFISGILAFMWAPPSASNFRSLANVYGYAILAIWAIFVLFSPLLLRILYSARPYDSQPFFFGIEGYLDIYNLELLIFGSYEKRLRWSTASSPLSRHAHDWEGMKADFFRDEHRSEETMRKMMKEVNMFTGLDPKGDPYVKNRVEEGETSSHNDTKIFTLIDTYTMTVTLFEAIRPPVAILLCGDEGGMQRALLCSEDWTKSILYRETVLRMETRVWSKLDGVSRVRLALRMEDSRGPVRDPKISRPGGDDWLSVLMSVFCLGAATFNWYA